MQKSAHAVLPEAPLARELLTPRDVEREYTISENPKPSGGQRTATGSVAWLSSSARVSGTGVRTWSVGSSRAARAPRWDERPRMRSARPWRRRGRWYGSSSFDRFDLPDLPVPRQASLVGPLGVTSIVHEFVELGAEQPTRRSSPRRAPWRRGISVMRRPGNGSGAPAGRLPHSQLARRYQGHHPDTDLATAMHCCLPVRPGRPGQLPSRAASSGACMNAAPVTSQHSFRVVLKRLPGDTPRAPWSRQ